jgi:hypothetical protein
MCRLPLRSLNRSSPQPFPAGDHRVQRGCPHAGRNGGMGPCITCHVPPLPCLSTPRPEHKLRASQPLFKPAVPSNTHGQSITQGVVERVIDRYVGEVAMLSDGTVVRVDQAHLETVIPAPGGAVLVVNGQHRGCRCGEGSGAGGGAGVVRQGSGGGWEWRNAASAPAVRSRRPCGLRRPGGRTALLLRPVDAT